MTTKIFVSQIDTQSAANVALTALPQSATLVAGNNITIAANGQISSTATGTAATEIHPFLNMGA
jgi:hypothetical protein